MFAVLKEPSRIMQRYQYRSCIRDGIRKEFGGDSKIYHQIMHVVDAVAETHDKGKRRDGSLLKSHEFQMFALAFYYLKIRDPVILLAILLHDMYEDYPEIWPLALIADRCGVEVAMLTDSVTKPDKTLFPDEAAHDQAMFAKVVQGGQKAMVLKCIDRFNNMVTLYGEKHKMVRKVEQTIVHVLPMTVQCQTLELELIAAVHHQMKRLRMHRRLRLW